MKIYLTEHERTVIADTLIDVGTVIALHLANKLLAQDTADDGPEVAILSVEPSTAAWS
jgi:hypothetical protein